MAVRSNAVILRMLLSGEPHAAPAVSNNRRCATQEPFFASVRLPNLVSFREWMADSVEEQIIKKLCKSRVYRQLISIHRDGTFFLLDKSLSPQT